MSEEWDPVYLTGTHTTDLPHQRIHVQLRRRYSVFLSARGGGSGIRYLRGIFNPGAKFGRPSPGSPEHRCQRSGIPPAWGKPSQRLRAVCELDWSAVPPTIPRTCGAATSHTPRPPFRRQPPSFAAGSGWAAAPLCQEFGTIARCPSVPDFDFPALQHFTKKSPSGPPASSQSPGGALEALPNFLLDRKKIRARCWGGPDVSLGTVNNQRGKVFSVPATLGWVTTFQTGEVLA